MEVQKVRRPLLQFPTVAKNHLLGAHDQVEKVLERKVFLSTPLPTCGELQVEQHSQDTTPDTVNIHSARGKVTYPSSTRKTLEPADSGFKKILNGGNRHLVSLLSSGHSCASTRLAAPDLAVRVSSARRAKNMSARQRVLRALKKDSCRADGVRV